MSTGLRTIIGWVEHRRVLGRIAFVIVRHDTTSKQVVVTSPELIERVRSLTPQSLVRVHAQLQDDDVVAHDLVVLNQAPPLPFPLAGKEPSLRTQLRHPALRLRRSRERHIFELQSELLGVLRNLLTQDGFVEVITPRFLSDPSEGGATLLRAQHFDREVYLSQSTQLYRQMLLPDLGKVYELTSVFHGDPHATRWHLNEFAALEVEFDDIAGLDDVVDLAVRLVRAALAHLTGAAANVIAETGADPATMTDSVPRLHYREALDILAGCYDLDLTGRFNLTPTGNRLLCEWVKEHHGSDLVVLEGAPSQHAQFYDTIDPMDPDYTRTFVVLCSGISFVCGGQRLHRLADYEHSLTKHEVRRESLTDYLAVMARGVRPHGGFSVAIARLLTATLRLDNIRRAVMFPRDGSFLSP